VKSTWGEWLVGLVEILRVWCREVLGVKGLRGLSEVGVFWDS